MGVKSRLVRFGIARSIYVGVVSVALVVTAVRTFSSSGDSTAAYDLGTQTETVPLPTAPGEPVPMTASTSVAPAEGSSQKQPTGTKVTTTVPKTTGAGTVPVHTVAGAVVTTTVAEQPHPTTTVRSTTTVVPTTSTTIYRPGSIVMVIPAGTQARINRGEDVSDVLPLTVDIKVGQYIYLVNKDNYFYSYGPLSVMPLDTTPYFFSTAGTQTGYCSISQSTITFRVTN